jgi:hypothetical protein
VLRGHENAGKLADGMSDTDATARTLLASPYNGIGDSPTRMTTSESEGGRRVSRRRGSIDLVGQHSLKLPLPVQSSTWPQSPENNIRSVGNNST